MFMIMIGGYMYLVSGGNTASMGKAKGIIVDAIVGLLLAFSAYLIVYVINPDLVQIKGICDTQSGGGGGSGGGSGGGGGNTGPIGNISPECDKYDDDFKAAASSKEDQCKLKAIAMTESTCNPNIGGSKAGAYGLMQIKPATANMTSEELKDPKKSIKKAAEILKEYKTKVNGYSSQYDIGDDDLIASYNAGTGTRSDDGKKMGPFAESMACKGRSGYPASMPAWQCPYKKADSDEKEGNGEGFDETRKYVEKVQKYQEQCMEK
jgi:hypothetical protein